MIPLCRAHPQQTVSSLRYWREICYFELTCGHTEMRSDTNNVTTGIQHCNMVTPFREHLEMSGADTQHVHRGTVSVQSRYSSEVPKSLMF